METEKLELAHLFKLQLELDQRINKEKGLEDKNLFSEKVLGLLSELGELANEQRSWKYWSNNRTPRTKALRTPSMMEEDKEYYNPLLEEFDDALHFILSLGLEIGVRDLEIYKHEIQDFKKYNVTQQFLMLYSAIAEFDLRRSEHWYRIVFKLFLALGDMLKLSWNEIVEGYMKKNEINHLRQEIGY